MFRADRENGCRNLKKKIYFLLAVCFLFFASAGDVHADSKRLWIRFDEAGQQIDRDSRSFVLRFGETPASSEDIGNLENVEVFYSNASKDGNRKSPFFHKLGIEYKDGEGRFSIRLDGTPWYFILARGVKSDNGVKVVYTARTDFISPKRGGHGHFIYQKYRNRLDAGPDFDFMVFYKRNKESLFDITINWSAIITVIKFNGQPFRNKVAGIYNPDGEGMQRVTNTAGSFIYTPWKINGHPAQNFISASVFLGNTYYTGTYTILLEPWTLPFSSGIGDQGVGFFIFVLSVICVTALLMFLRRCYGV